MTKAGEKIIAAARGALDMVKECKPYDERARRGGWAPGMYWCHCLECQSDFIGDKRATECADCAYGSGLEQRAALRVVEQAGDLAHSAADVLTPKTDAEKTVDDLAMLVRKLVRHMPEGAELRVQAVDYLHRKGLLGSPLR